MIICVLFSGCTNSYIEKWMDQSTREEFLLSVFTSRHEVQRKNLSSAQLTDMTPGNRKHALFTFPLPLESIQPAEGGRVHWPHHSSSPPFLSPPKHSSVSYLFVS